MEQSYREEGFINASALHPDKNRVYISSSEANIVRLLI